MASAQKFNSFVEYLAEKVINTETDTFKVMLVNTAPVSTNTVKADLTEISAGNGYSAGGNTASVTSSGQNSGTFKLVLADPATWTASGGSIGPFRYAVLYDDTPTSPADPLVLFWDYGSAVTLAAGETFTVDFDSSAGVLQIA
jgi:hypothetical protein